MRIDASMNRPAWETGGKSRPDPTADPPVGQPKDLSADPSAGASGRPKAVRHGTAPRATRSWGRVAFEEPARQPPRRGGAREKEIARARAFRVTPSGERRLGRRSAGE